MKSFNKRLALTTLARFLFVPRGGPWPLEAVRRDKASMDGSESTNKKNVHYHYDLSNRFYELFLDPEMVYTCAYFKDWNNDLATAQADKLDMICRKLRLKPGETLLDIGCGWGALVCHAAKHYGVHAHGVTLAEEQFAYAKERVARLGLEGKVTLELRDYALVQGNFDKIASIGMFEQVGIANHPTYFQTVNRLLKPGGLYLHHAIALPLEELRTLSPWPPAGCGRSHRDRPLHFSRRRTRSPRHVDRQSRDVITSRSTTSRPGASITCAPPGFGTIDCRPIARLPRSEVGREKTRLWIAYLAVVSIAFAQGTIGIFQTLASAAFAVHQDCRRHGPICTKPIDFAWSRPARDG